MENMILLAIDQETLATLNFAVLTLTLLTVVIYTAYAARQVNEMIRQRRISLMPKLTGEIATIPERGSTLTIVNIGNGTAVNVYVDDIAANLGEGIDIRISFDRLLYLKPTTGDDAPAVSMYIEWGGDDPQKSETWQQVSPTNFIPRDKDNGFSIRATFEDIDGTRYEQVLGFAPIEMGFQCCSLGKQKRL